MKNNRSRLLDSYARSLLRALDVDPDDLPRHTNPISEALASNAAGFTALAKSLKGYSKMAVAKTFCACQARIYDYRNGPDGDGKPKSIRRLWYDAFKTEFAAPFAKALGEAVVNSQGIEEIKFDGWEDLQSDVYSFFVDTGLVTYRDLWVEDASRKMKSFYDRLFDGCHILIAIEKSSLFDDFVPPARAMGAALYSGAGKSSRAGMEKVIRECFGWDDDGYGTQFTAEHPLVIIHISDWDYDGERVIGPAFGNQARRYGDHIFEARVGINPENVEEAGQPLDRKWYEVKVKDQGYIKWSEEKALFYLVCQDCGHSWIGVGIQGACPECGGTPEEINVKEVAPHGFEIEALPTRTYRKLLVRALLSVLPYDYILARLRDECQADAYTAADRIARNQILANNPSYQRLLEELAAFDRMNAVKDAFERRAAQTIRELAEPHVEDFRDEGLDPDPAAFEEHVDKAEDYSSPWRPFSQDDRTESLVNWLLEDDETSAVIEGLASEELSW